MEPIRVSYSQLGVWDRCHFLYDLSYNQGWKPKVKKDQLELGSLIHLLLAEWYTSHSWENILATVNTWANEGKDMDLVSRAGIILNRYVNDYAAHEDRNWKILDIEHKFEIPMCTPNGVDFILVGYIDLVIEEFGKVWGVDHKSVGHGKFWTPSECMVDVQLPTYQIAKEVSQNEHWFGVMFNQLNTYQYKDWKNVEPEKLFKRERTYRTRVELTNLLQELYRAVEELAGNRHDTRRSLRRDCSFCAFQDPCLLGLKGVPLAETLALGFEKKEEIVSLTD